MSYGADGGLLAQTWNGSGVQSVLDERTYNPLGEVVGNDIRRGGLEAGRIWRFTNLYPGTGNNGNLTKLYVETGTQTYGVTFGYDAVNRLTGAGEDAPNEFYVGTGSCASIGGTWCVQYSYDQFGNAWTASKSTTARGLKQIDPSWYLPNGVGEAVTNRLKDGFYYGSGQQYQWLVGDSQSFATYDAEGRLTQAARGVGDPPTPTAVENPYLKPFPLEKI